MRTYTHRSARRNLAATKRSIVMFCAGIALILGTTSFGPSIFTEFTSNEIVPEDGATASPLASDLEAEAQKKRLAAAAEPKVLDTQTVTVPNKPAATPSKSLALSRGLDNSAGSAAASAVIEEITPTAPEQATTEPTTPTEPIGGENGGGTTEPEEPGEGTTDPGTGEGTTEPEEPSGGELGGDVEIEEEPEI